MQQDTKTIEDLEAALIACQRQAMTGPLAAMLAHEFNNLMTPVLARAQDALERDDVPAMRKALTVTINQTQKAIAATRRLIELSQGAPLGVRPCPLKAVVEDAVAAGVRPLAKDGIELVLEIPDDLLVSAERLLLEQVLLNLLLNARAANQARGGRIVVRAEPQGNFVAIEVSDTGCGISRERIEQVINPFLTADRRERSIDTNRVGLGLNVCRLIVQQHGGRMELATERAPGCTVRLRWPAAA